MVGADEVPLPRARNGNATRSGVTVSDGIVQTGVAPPSRHNRLESPKRTL